MNKIKNYLVVLGLFIFTFSSLLNVSAQTTVNTWLFQSNMVTNIFLSGPVTVKRVTVSAVGSTPQFLFYDFNSNASPSAWSALIFSNTVAYSNLVTINPYTNDIVFTNSLNQTRTNRYIGMFQYWTNVAAGTFSNVPSIGSFATQSGIPYTVDVNWVLEKGLTVRLTNGFGPIIILEYQ